MNVAADNYFRVGRACFPFESRRPDAVDAAYRNAQLAKAEPPLGSARPPILLWKPVQGIRPDGYIGVCREDTVN